MKVNEIFQSIQGEGPGSGRRACFVRLSGCNLACSWCDSKYASSMWVDLSGTAILEAVHRIGCKYVVVTGGEPLVQDEVQDLIAALCAAGIEVDVETNGTILPKQTEGGYENLARYIVSPKNKDWVQVDKWIASGLRCVFKFVVDELDYQDYIAMCKDRKIQGAWFMPRTDIGLNYGQQMYQAARLGNLIINELNTQQYDGYLCTRLQNFYRVR